MKTGKICPSFLIDEALAGELLSHSWVPTTGGYLQCTVRGKPVFLHRMVFLLSRGHLPVHCVDHINRNKLDNRASNLRDATPSENTKNGGSAKPCGSGSSKRKSGLPVGVYECVGRGGKKKYRAIFKEKHLGYYDCPGLASDSYQNKLKEHSREPR